MRLQNDWVDLSTATTGDQGTDGVHHRAILEATATDRRSGDGGVHRREKWSPPQRTGDQGTGVSCGAQDVSWMCWMWFGGCCVVDSHGLVVFVVE